MAASYIIEEPSLYTEQSYTYKVIKEVYFSASLPGPMAQQPLVGQGLLIIEASRSHSVTPQSVGLLWTSAQPVAKTST